MSGWLNLAKVALTTAQRRIDQALDIHSDDENADQEPQREIQTVVVQPDSRDADDVVAVQLCTEALISRVCFEVDNHVFPLAGHEVGKRSGYTSPADGTETTLSSDFEMVSNSLDDNLSDRSSIVNLCDSNGRQSLATLLQRKLTSSKPEPNVLEVMAHYEKKMLNLTDRLAAERSRADRLAADNEQLKRAGAGLKERDARIADLLAEGQQLSKKEVQQANLIKRLRERETDLTRQVDRLKSVQNSDLVDRDRLKREVHDLRRELDEKENACRRLDSSLQRAEGEATKCRQHQAQLEKLQRENAELTAAKATVVHELQQLNEWKNRNSEQLLRDHYEGKESEWREERTAVGKQLEAANAMLRRVQDEHASRESSLKADLAQLRQRLQASEARNQDMAENAANSSKPLLVQIAALRATQQAQQQRWEENDRMLRAKLEQSEQRFQYAECKANQSTSAAAKLSAELDELKCKFNANVDELISLKGKLESTEAELLQSRQTATRLTEELNQLHLKNDQKLLGERQEGNDLQPTAACEHREQMQIIDSLKSQLELKQQEMAATLQLLFSEQQQHSQTLEVDDESRPQQSDWEAWANIGMTEQRPTILPDVTDRLQSYENEMQMLREELCQMQMSRNRLVTYMTSLNQEFGCTKQELDRCREFEQKYTSLEEEHRELMQMYGEVSEEKDALVAELRDVKDIFRKQIDELLQSRDIC